MRSHQFRFQGHLAFCLLLRGKVRTNVTGAGASSSLHAFPSGKNKSKAKGKKRKPAGRAKQKGRQTPLNTLVTVGRKSTWCRKIVGWRDRKQAASSSEHARRPGSLLSVESNPRQATARRRRDACLRPNHRKRDSSLHPRRRYPYNKESIIEVSRQKREKLLPLIGRCNTVHLVSERQ
jgi:hypothetical protein